MSRGAAFVDMKMEGRRLKQQLFAHLLKNLPRRPTQLLPALLLSQATIGSLGEDELGLIAAHLCISGSEVGRAYEAFFGNRQHHPHNTVMRVCTGPSCRAAGAVPLLAALTAREEHGVGVATAGERISIEGTACCYLCNMAPVIEVDGTYLGRVSEEAANEYIHNPLTRLPRADYIALETAALGSRRGYAAAIGAMPLRPSATRQRRTLPSASYCVLFTHHSRGTTARSTS